MAREGYQPRTGEAAPIWRLTMPPQPPPGHRWAPREQQPPVGVPGTARAFDDLEPGSARAGDDQDSVLYPALGQLDMAEGQMTLDRIEAKLGRLLALVPQAQN